MGLRNYLLRHLLHYANADPGFTCRDEFYELKERLLNRHARFRGYLYQEIKAECWGSWMGYCGPHCSRCGGTGIYQQRWHRLQRWQWGEYEFLVPVESLCRRPEKVHIEGRVRQPEYGLLSDEAKLWLFLLTGHWGSLWRCLRGSCVCGWTFLPLLNVQKVVFGWGRWRDRRRVRRMLSKWRLSRKAKAWVDRGDEEVPF